jgi:hypothetical protein
VVESVYVPTPASNYTFWDVDLDAKNDLLYFLQENTIGPNSYAFGKVGTDGSDPEIIVENDEASEALQPHGLALDIANNRAFVGDRLGGTHAIDLTAPTYDVTEIGATSSAFRVGLSFSPTDDAVFYPRETAPVGDMQSIRVSDGTLTNYTDVEAAYALDLLVPHE